MSQRTRAAELLRTYTPDDPRERDFKTRMLELLEARGDPFSRSHFVPGHFTASAFVLSPDSDALYLIHHKKLERWLQPGGHVEQQDRDLFATAIREVEEEVGLRDVREAAHQTRIFDVDIHAIPARKAEPAHLHFDVRFVFVAPSVDAVNASDEVNDGRWVPLHELALTETDESVLRAARKLRSNAG